MAQLADTCGFNIQDLGSNPRSVHSSYYFLMPNLMQRQHRSIPCCFTIQAATRPGRSIRGPRSKSTLYSQSTRHTGFQSQRMASLIGLGFSNSHLLIWGNPPPWFAFYIFFFLHLFLLYYLFLLPSINLFFLQNIKTLKIRKNTKDIIFIL